jgi:hypothetical protein
MCPGRALKMTASDASGPKRRELVLILRIRQRAAGQQLTAGDSREPVCSRRVMTQNAAQKGAVVVTYPLIRATQPYLSGSVGPLIVLYGSLENSESRLEMHDPCREIAESCA